jgi:hypothetical protein
MMARVDGLLAGLGLAGAVTSTYGSVSYSFAYRYDRFPRHIVGPLLCHLMENRMQSAIYWLI